MFRLINQGSHWFVCLFVFFISAAHAVDGVKLPTGAEDQYVSLGAEGSRRVGVGPHGAQLAVSLPAGNVPAALLTCHSASPSPAICLHGPPTHRWLRPGPPSAGRAEGPSSRPLAPSLAAVKEVRGADFRGVEQVVKLLEKETVLSSP